MVKVRALTDDGDLLYEGGKQSTVEGLDAEVQAIRVGLGHIRNENVWHPNLGLDLGQISRLSPDDQRAAVESAVMATGRVSRVLEVRRLSDFQKDRSIHFQVRGLFLNGSVFTAGVAL